MDRDERIRFWEVARQITLGDIIWYSKEILHLTDDAIIGRLKPDLVLSFKTKALHIIRIDHYDTALAIDTSIAIVKAIYRRIKLIV